MYSHRKPSRSLSMDSLSSSSRGPRRSYSADTFVEEKPTYQMPQQMQDKIYNSFGKRNPLMTVIMCSRGPFMAEIFKAIYAILDTYWVSVYTYEVGNAAMTIVTVMELIIKAFGSFMGWAASYKLALLRGENKAEECPQVFADLLKITLLMGIITPIILLPCVDPILTFFGADGQIRQAGQDYLFPAILGSGVSILNTFLCGCLQSEGKSLIAGIDQTISCVLNMAIFDPIFIGVCRFGIKGCAYANICADTIVVLIFGANFILKQFESQCTMKNLLKCGCSSYTLDAIKIGFVQFITQFCFTIPSFVIRKYIEIGSKKNGKYQEMYAAFNPVSRFWSLPGSYAMALSICTFPCVSYAVGRKDGARVKKILITAFILSIVWCSTMEAILLTCAKYIAWIFDHDPEFIYNVTKMTKIYYCCAGLLGIELVCSTFIQTMDKATRAIILSFLTRFLPVPVFASILFFSNPKRDVFTTLWCYPISDVYSFSMGLLFINELWTQLNNLGGGYDAIP